MNRPYLVFNNNFKNKNIKKVYENSIKNKPSVGIDGININVFEKKVEEEIKIIHDKIFNQTYNFSFYKEKLISKGRHKYPRVISIPTIRDKIVLKILFNTLNKIYENELSNDLVHTTIDNIINNVRGTEYDSFIKIDVENFYPSLNHDILLKFISKKSRKKEFLSILKKAFTQETLSKPSPKIEKYTNKLGVPQGLSISSILASIYLIDFDKEHSNNGHYKYYRYVDDVLILCKKEDIKTIFNEIDNDMKELKLKIHDIGVSDEKTDAGSLRDGFYFLGYNFQENTITVRDSSINNLHNSIINIFTQYKHSKIKNEELLYWKLNLKITGCKFEDKKYGWLYFFSQINDKILLFKLDHFVKSLFSKFGFTYDKNRTKKFIRTYYEILKNRTNTNYIPNFSELTIEQKEDILRNTFQLTYVMTNSQIEDKFNKIIYKTVKEMEKDIQRY